MACEREGTGAMHLDGQDGDPDEEMRDDDDDDLVRTQH